MKKKLVITRETMAVMSMKNLEVVIGGADESAPDRPTANIKNPACFPLPRPQAGSTPSEGEQP